MAGNVEIKLIGGLVSEVQQRTHSVDFQNCSHKCMYQVMKNNKSLSPH